MKTDRLHRPRVLTRCPANAHTGAGERIIEFSFPGRGTDGSVAGGLISFRDLGPDRPPRVEVYRTDGQVTVLGPKVKVWAASYGMPRYGTHGIELHATEVAALQAIADGLGSDFIETDDIRGGDAETCRQLRNRLEKVDGLDWHVEEVETP